MINKYPYSDMHELNADWLLSKTAELEARVKQLEDGGFGVTDLTPSYNSGRKLADFELNGQAGAIYEPVDALPELANAGYHNSIYRGKKLGNSITAEQWSEISAGTFSDMFIGDYWTLPITINGVTSNMDFIIAAFDYWWNVGDTFPQGSNKHHVVMVPRGSLYTAQMNSTNITTGGYVGSEMYTTNLTEARNAINSTFASHIYSVRKLFTVSVGSDGQPSGWSWVTSNIDLMSEIMVFGSKVWGNSGYDVGCDMSILPLFALNPESRSIRNFWWLRSVASSSYFAYVNYYGNSICNNASNANGVRPCFAIY